MGAEPAPSDNEHDANGRARQDNGRFVAKVSGEAQCLSVSPAIADALDHAAGIRLTGLRSVRGPYTARSVQTTGYPFQEETT